MKAARSLSLLVVALLAASGCEAAASPPEEVVIGADLELSGPDAGVGKVYEQALRLRVEQLNHDGIPGNRILRLIVRDNRSDPATSAANIAELAANSSVRALVTGACGRCIVDSAAAVNEAGLPTISLARTNKATNPIGERRAVFKVGPNADDDATILTSELVTTGVQRVSIVASDDLFGQESVDALTVRFGRSKIAIGMTETVPAAGADAAAVAARIARARPVAQAVVIVAAPAVASGLATALRAEGFTGRLMLGSSAADSLFVTGDSVAAVEGAGLVFTPTLVSDDVIATSPAKSTRIAWFRSYLSTYGTYSAYSSFAADALGLVVEAVTQTNSTDRAMLRNAIETTRMDGLSGPIRMTPNNHSGLMPQAVTLLVATNGRWRLAS